MLKQDHIDAIGIVEDAIKSMYTFDYYAAGIPPKDAGELYKILCRVSYHLKIGATVDFPNWAGYEQELALSQVQF